MSEWHPTACVLCENNCGIEVRLGGEDGRTIEKIRGDKAHPASKGYLCQKSTQINHYQNGIDRIKRPLRRKADGSFEEIPWSVAIAEIAQKLGAIRDNYGGDKIFYYGGGGQGNHLPGAYAMSTMAALGGRYRSNALAQEKTGEGWVASRMFGAYARTGDYEHCEVAVFLGKNPMQSHGVQRARVTVKEIAKDPNRTLVVFDPRVSETAEIADFHVRVKPGTDAWALGALLGVLVQDGLLKQAWLDEHTQGAEAVLPALAKIPVAAYCRHAGVEETQIRALAERLAGAQSVAFYEDLGIQMNRHSTLVSFLHRLVWLLTGSFGRKGTQFIPNMIRPLMSSNTSLARRTPVTGMPLLGGLVACNVIPDEILTEHPDRFRAMLIETANPAHSLADSRRFVDALKALEVVVVIDVALTETARHADYVLPTPTQYEKAEATFFNFEFPTNHFHLRQPILPPPADADVLPEAEIHCRLVEALGSMSAVVEELANVARNESRVAFAEAFQHAMQADPSLNRLASLVLYRALGPTLPEGYENGASLWGVAHYCATHNAEPMRRAGLDGDGPLLGENLFDRMIGSPRGFVFSVDDHDASWQRVKTANQHIQMAIPELFAQLESLHSGPEPLSSDEFPFTLSAGERRSYTANTVVRTPAWRKKDSEGALRISPEDAARLGLESGDTAKVSTRSGNAEVQVEVSTRMQAGHVSLPNGFGLDNHDGSQRRGVAPNELTAGGDRDWFAGTPWHKNVPANIEPI